MDLGRAFRYFLDRPGGTTSLLLLVVCQFIPVVGPVVMMGYRAEVAEALARDPALRRHPGFTFDRFVEYLSRGVWPFLAALVLSLPVTALVMGALVAGFVIDPPGPNNPPLLAIGLFFAAYAVGLALYFVVSVPVILHTELAATLDPAAAWRFTLDFWGRVGGRAVAAGLVFVPLSVAVILLGLLACFVGVYPASVLVQMAGTHVVVQLYRLYLDRGGEPIAGVEPRWAGDRYEEDERDDGYDDRGDR